MKRLKNMTKKSQKADYHARKQDVCESIKELYHEFKGIIGHRSMKIFLERKGYSVSKTTVHKYMNKELPAYLPELRTEDGRSSAVTFVYQFKYKL